MTQQAFKLLLSNEIRNVFLAELGRKVWTLNHEGFFTGHPVYIYIYIYWYFYWFCFQKLIIYSSVDWNAQNEFNNIYDYLQRLTKKSTPPSKPKILNLGELLLWSQISNIFYIETILVCIFECVVNKEINLWLVFPWLCLAKSKLLSFLFCVHLFLAFEEASNITVNPKIIQ